MNSTDAAFSGSIPALYDRCLGPLLFEPYARDLAERIAPIAPRRILETAAGTGIVTSAMVREVPDAEIVATDLNQAMLDVAAGRVSSPAVTFQQADALALPYGDGAFDLVVCQFGAMFFPDRVAAYREARRVLKRGGLFLFNVWDSLEKNPAADGAARAVAALFPENPPSFLDRVPYGYHDTARIEQELRRAGFEDVAAETVVKTGRASSEDAAAGLVLGSPLRLEIEQRDPAMLEPAREAAAAALAGLADDDGTFEAPMSAYVLSARS